MRSDAAMNAEAAALRSLFSLGRPAMQAVCELMQAKLDDAHEQMETARDQQQFFRFQGRAQLAREVLSQLMRQGANITEIL